LGALLTMAASGVRPREVWDGMSDLLTQSTGSKTPSDDQEVYDEALKKLNEERASGARYKPTAGARNEKGEVYDAAVGGWVKKEDHEVLTGVMTQEHSEQTENAVRKAMDRVREESQKLQNMQEQHQRNAIARQRERVAVMETLSSRGYNAAHVTDLFFDNVDKDFQQWGEGLYQTYESTHYMVTHPGETLAAAKEKISQFGTAAGGIASDMAKAGVETLTEVVTHFPDSAVKVAGFYYDTGVKAAELTAKGLTKTYNDPWGAAEKTWGAAKTVGKFMASPVLDIVDEKRTLGQRLTSVALLELDVATAGGGRGVGTVMSVSNMSASKAGRVGSTVVDVSSTAGRAGRVGEEVTEAVVDIKRADKSGRFISNAEDLATEGRAGKKIAAGGGGKGPPGVVSGVEQIPKEILEKKAAIKTELETLAKSNIPDKDKEAMLARIREQDGSALAVVRNELDSGTAAERQIGKGIGRVTENFNKRTINNTSLELKKEGYDVEKIKLGGKINGNDLDAEYTVSKNGKLLSEKETRAVVDSAKEKVFQKQHGDLQVKPEELGHNTINNNPSEKFKVSPSEMGITETTYHTRPNGTVNFEKYIEKPGAARPSAATISDRACTRENIDSINRVTLNKIATYTAKGSKADDFDLMRMSQEIEKTYKRTITSVAEKTGHKLSPEFETLMRKLETAGQGRNLKNLPPPAHIEHIIDNEMRQMSANTEKVLTFHELALKRAREA
jgi:hypothetical protein